MDDGFFEDDPVYWRRRATEAYVQADAIHDQELRFLMTGVATGYDRIADWLERRNTGRAC